MNTWAEYTGAFTQLSAMGDSAIRDEQSHQLALGDTEAQLSELDARLHTVSAKLTGLASQLRLPAPALAPATPAMATENLPAAISAATGAVQHAENAVAHAQQQAIQPVLLPGTSPTGRAVLVYGGWCLVFWLVQCGLLIVTGFGLSAALASLCAMPLLAFAAGFGTLQTAGQPRSGPKISYRLRYGALICLLGMPVAWLVLVFVMAAWRT